MDPTSNLIDELERAMADKQIGHRAEALRRVTDLFVSQASQLSGERLALFDDIMVRFLREVDEAARAAFGERIAALGAAPPKLVHALALDDSIAVAGPVLRDLAEVAEITLVDSARTKSQAHLKAISQRPTLSEAVTDVLVTRGDREVALLTAGNAGARFSEQGYATLVQRAGGDDELARSIWTRLDIPRRHLLVLFDTASAAVCAELTAGPSVTADELNALLGRARDHAQAFARARSDRFRAVEVELSARHANGDLGESHLAAFAAADQFDEVSITLALLADAPLGAIERALAHETCDQLLVASKSIPLGWATVRLILAMKMSPGLRLPGEIDAAAARYARLQPETARRAMQYYRLRNRAANGQAA